MSFLFPSGSLAVDPFEELNLMPYCGRLVSKRTDEVHTTHFMKGFHLKKKELAFQETKYYRLVDRVLLKHIEKGCKLKKIKNGIGLLNLYQSFGKLCHSQCIEAHKKALSTWGILERKRGKNLERFKEECPQLCRFANKEHNRLFKKFNKMKSEDPERDQLPSIAR